MTVLLRYGSLRFLAARGAWAARDANGDQLFAFTAASNRTTLSITASKSGTFPKIIVAMAV